MKHVVRIITISCAVLFLLLANFSHPQKSYATPPQALIVSYDANFQILTVTITHESPFTSFHYIEYVEIKKNNSIMGNNIYDSQLDPKTFTYTYKLSAAKGDTLAVTASCSMWGHKTTTLIVGQTK
jgi:hypothetical protein